MSGIDIENLEEIVEVSLQDEVIPVGGGGAGVSSFKGRTGAVQPQSGDYTKAMVGLGNVDNTSDADKPVSTAQQTALNLKANNTQTFTEAETRENIASGETVPTLFGKIKKFFSDLKAVAFSGSYNDLNDTPEPYSLPIASGNTLGGIKVGSGLSITSGGVLSATGGGGSGSLTSIYYDFANDTSADGQGTIYIFNADSTRLYNVDIMWGDANGIMSNYLPINTIDVTLPYADKVTYNHFNTYNAIPKYSDRVLAVKDGVILAEYVFPANKLWDATVYGNHLYSVGLLSDVHYQYETADTDWETACDYLDQRESVEAICIAGDLTSDGTQAHLNQWKSARNAHANNKPVYSCSGNHESYGDNAYMVTNPSNMRQYLDSEWTSETENYFVKIIENDVYIFIPIFEGVKASKANTMFSATVLSWLETTLETYRNQRVFLFSHVPPYQGYVPSGFWNGNGAYSLNLWGNGGTILADRTAFLALLAHYKNVIWFGGHSHIKYCYQETWANLNTARYNTDGAQMVHVSSLTVPRDIIDGSVSGYIYAESEGAVMDVYPNHVIIRNRNFKDGKFIGIAQYIIDTTPVVIPPASKTLVSISATKTVTTYSVGDTLSTADIAVTATYNDTTTADVTASAVFDTSNVNMNTAGTYSIGVSYTEGGVTETTSVSITVSAAAKVLQSVTATKTTTAYNVGDTLTTNDITVTAHYSDSTSADVTSSATINTSSVDMNTAGTYSIGISYTEDGITVTTSINIAVSAVLQSISATKTKTSYNVGDTLNTNDITVTASYSDSTTADVTASATINTSSVDMTTSGTYSIGVSYTEDGVTETTSISITVSAGPTKHVIGTLTYPSHTFTAASQTDANKVSLDVSSAAGKTLYARATSITYTGTDSEEEKVGLMMVLSKDKSHTASSYIAATAPDYKAYVTEAEIVSKTSGNNFGTYIDETYKYILCQGKSSSSSTATFPVDFAITIEVYYYE